VDLRQVGGDHAGAEEAAARLTALGERTGDTGIGFAALTARHRGHDARRLADARRASTRPGSTISSARPARDLCRPDAGAMRRVLVCARPPRRS
jgi:hypothetical protein